MKKDKIVSEHSSEKAKVAAALFDQQLSRVNGVPQNTHYHILRQNQQNA